MNTSESTIFEKLYTRLYELLFTLNRYVPNIGCQTILSMYDQININIVMLRYLKILSEHTELLKSQVHVNDEIEKMFVNDLIILPEVNLKEIWPQLSIGQKNKIWMYMRLVYLTGFQAVQQSSLKKETIPYEKVDAEEKTEKNNANNANNANNDKEKEEEIHVDPFIGVGTDNKDYCVNDIYENMQSLEDIKFKEAGAGSFMSFLGIDKLLDFDQIAEQLKNMTPEAIDQATNSIQSILGESNTQTKNFLNSLVGNITNSLKTTDFSELSSIETMDCFGDIVSNVTKAMKPQVRNKDINPKNLLDDANGLVKELANSQGVDATQQKQINALSGMFSKLCKNPGQKFDKKDVNAMFKEAGIDPKQVNKIAKTMRK